MKYYVVSDIHGFYGILKAALAEAGFFRDSEPHKLLVLGDLFDGGKEAAELQRFILDRMNRDEVILVKGNHEDLFAEAFPADGTPTFGRRISGEAYDTAMQLTGYNWVTAQLQPFDFRKTRWQRRFISA